MLKEIKYIFFFLIIFLFFFVTFKYYISDKHEKKYFRSINNLEETINEKKKNLILLESNTENIKLFIDENKNQKKKFNFWNLLKNED
tara:strand:- start:3759 stop:4019 length:261 start_codon:yes stop_codon:yes gene_type:complete